MSDSKHSDFRRFLEYIFQEIYILELKNEDDGLAVLYLIKKAKATKTTNIQHTDVSLLKFNQEETKDFEELKWQNVYTDQQDYWLGLPESDFFQHLAIYDQKSSIFDSYQKGSARLMEAWFTDINPKLLEKKVKFVLRQYAKLHKKNDVSDPLINWPAHLLNMAEEGVTLTFDKQKIKKIELEPYVSVFAYVEEKLIAEENTGIPAIAYSQRHQYVYPLVNLWGSKFWNKFFVFPLNSQHLSGPSSLNISDSTLKNFKEHYQKKTKAHNQTFIVFPPEGITQTLDKIESVSRDLPVISKYPTQINNLLEEARHFTSDVELLTPPYKKIDEFKRKVLRLERDAIERKVIYQKVKAYIEELKDQLAILTRAHDDAKKDAEAVNKENIFYYTFAVLHDPEYPHKYQEFLEKELPRVPLYPGFRQWVAWGKLIFVAHTTEHNKSSIPSAIQMKEEIHEKKISKYFSYQFDVERGLIILTEQNKSVTLSNIPNQVWKYQFDGRYPFAHYLEYLLKWQRKKKKNQSQFNLPILDEPSEIIEQIKHLCSLSVQLVYIAEEMKDASRQPSL
ncbi:type ISP restriction/modification enzyme [Catalinimonas alkaloidigena]|uniref:type ISP restriction/modification enzyme n=1 Tax=Catalinimonas alkaloidigena TaxID=1075417 RepID=UPI002406E107|nr:type ISP restriction/modification enzyme [Catalinimonas alkaloidigena]